MKQMRSKTTAILSLLPLGIVFLSIAVVFIGYKASSGQENPGSIELGIIGTLDLYPVLPDEGDSVVIGVLIANRGVKDARDVPVYFYEDDVYFDKVTADIRAGDTVYIEANWTADSGDSYISVIVDPNREYPEDRRDNEANAWVTVR